MTNKYCVIVAEDGFVIVIRRFVRLYEEIIHELKFVDYLPCRRPNQSITIFYHPISVDLARYEYFVIKFAVSGIARVVLLLIR